MQNVNPTKLVRASGRTVIETFFLLSPLAVLLLLIFNITDTKWILSRLIPIVCVYCVIFYRDSFKKNWQSPELKASLVAGGVAFIYFTLGHVFRGDNFGFARTLIVCLGYIALVPWHRISAPVVKCLILIGALTSGINAVYEYVVLHQGRVGVATNPIPHALYCSIMALVSICLLVSSKNKLFRAVCVLAIALSTIALFLTEVRGVMLFFPIVVIFLVEILAFNRGWSRKLALVITLCCITVGYFTFKEKIDTRITHTISELKMSKSEIAINSVGIRLELWSSGINTGLDNIVLGVGDNMLHENIKALPNSGAAIQPHLHNQFIDTFARYGILGLMILLFWVFAPLVYMCGKGRKISFSDNPAVASIVSMIFLAGLTDVPFHHTHIVYLFTILSCVLLVLKLPSGDLQ
ncbi:O-antigen ligase family protein [Enterovibrio norvegicus]|uniref:O-antigen ligase family protein n=1 Tax=Enterovibrio norvegicus TaxID=188144 RepID=UPI00352F847F